MYSTAIKEMKAAEGYSNRILTVESSTFSTLSIYCRSFPVAGRGAPGTIMLLKLHTTSSTVISIPSDHLTPGRI